MEYLEYQALKNTINHHMELYYNQDLPEISDYEYDQLMIRLKAAEKEHPEWVTPDSPSQKIGGSALKGENGKIIHNIPMLSIQDLFTLDDVRSWIDAVKKLHPDATFSVEQKIDGLSATLRYRRESGKLHLYLAETRGTGFEGDDCTPNIRMIPDVAQDISLPYDYLELRGEVYMTRANFDRYNILQEENGKKIAANPRNLAAGTLRLLDAELTKERGLSMFVFNVQDGPAELLNTHCEALNVLTDAGVVCVYHKLCTDVDEVVEAINSIGESRAELPYDIDGAVVKIDQINYRKDFPAGSKYSAGHIAYKYPPEERNVIMDDILVDVGRTGKLTFTGVFHDAETGKAARLCGTSVSRATLHNQDYITEMKIGVGGTYKVYKSGEIIPRLNGCVAEPNEVFKAPANCPVCGARLIREEDTADIRCINPTCRAQLSRTISYFASVNCMKIDALGDKLIDALISAGYLSNYADIYTLKNHREQLIESGLIGKEKNTDRILAAIEASKLNEPTRLLAGLGIRNVGIATARELMKSYKSISLLEKATVEELSSIQDIGETTAKCIVDFFNDEHNQKILSMLQDAGVNMAMPDDKRGSNKLEGLTLVVTGTLPNLSRKEIEDLILSNGGKMAGSVSKKTNYLIAGEAAGSKLTKAQALGITILSEDDFLKMVSDKT